MDKKQKEALVIAMLEKGESYRDIAQKAKVSPNTIKMLANRAGLDESTSISSRTSYIWNVLYQLCHSWELQLRLATNDPTITMLDVTSATKFV